MKYEGTTKAGQKWVIEAASLTTFALGAETVYPVVVVPPPPVQPPVIPPPANTGKVSTAGFTLSADKKTATFNGYKLVSRWGFWGGPVLTSGSWKDTVTLSRVDGTAFTFNGVTATSHTLPQTGQTNQQWPEFEVTVTPILVPPQEHLYGTIVDNGAVATNHFNIMDVGFAGLRMWLSYNPTTGVASAEGISRANTYRALGLKVVVVLHPEKRTNADGTTTRVVPVDINVASLAALDMSIDAHILNEPNLPDYWPNGDWEGAWEYASRNSTAIRATGRKTGTPSFAYQDATEVGRRLDAMKAKGQMNFDKLVCHNYPFYDASFPDGKTTEFENLLRAYDTRGLAWGMAVSVDEWGFKPQYTQADIQRMLPVWLAKLAQYSDESFYFIFNWVDKDPHRDYPWLVKGTTRSPYYAIFQEAL